MNKQDKKEIMNLIKYKKMLGGRRMNLEKAIKLLKSLKSSRWFEYAGDRGKKILSDEEDNAIDTVLTALDERYNKGYQDGFKQAKSELKQVKSDLYSANCVIEDLVTVTRDIKIKDEYLLLIDMMLYDYDGCKTVKTLKELIDEVRDYIHKALKNDDKSVITVNSKKKFNILHEEVE